MDNKEYFLVTFKCHWDGNFEDLVDAGVVLESWEEQHILYTTDTSELIMKIEKFSKEREEKEEQYAKTFTDKDIRLWCSWRKIEVHHLTKPVDLDKLNK